MAAVEKLPAPQEKRDHAVKRQLGFLACDTRIAVSPAAGGVELGAFLNTNLAAGLRYASLARSPLRFLTSSTSARNQRYKRDVNSKRRPADHACASRLRMRKRRHSGGSRWSRSGWLSHSATLQTLSGISACETKMAG